MNKLLIGAVVFAGLIGVPTFAAERANKAEAEAETQSESSTSTDAVQATGGSSQS